MQLSTLHCTADNRAKSFGEMRVIRMIPFQLHHDCGNEMFARHISKLFVVYCNDRVSDFNFVESQFENSTKEDI